MSGIGAIVRTCSACHGAGHLKPDARDCKFCLGAGRMVVCEECGLEMPIAEAKGEGAYCAGCREEMDIKEQLDAVEHAS